MAARHPHLLVLRSVSHLTIFSDPQSESIFEFCQHVYLAALNTRAVSDAGYAKNQILLARQDGNFRSVLPE